MRDAKEREQQALEREARLLSLLEAEQATRRELEQRLLPPPETRPAPIPRVRPWLVIALLVVVLAALAAIFIRSELIRWLIGS